MYQSAGCQNLQQGSRPPCPLHGAVCTAEHVRGGLVTGQRGLVDAADAILAELPTGLPG
jgi:hypothetical protein